MSDALQETIVARQAALRENPERARATFRSSSCLREAFRSEVNIRAHTLVVDEPPQLGGGDAGPNPVELILAALGSCQEITYRAFASALGIPLERVAVELEGEIDLRGFFGVDATVRAGFERIRGRVHLESSAPAADLARLKALVDRHCPVLDMLSTPVPVTLEQATG